MTLYLTEATDPDDVAAAAEEGLVKAVKLYPAGATTNSASGVHAIAKVMPVLERMAAIGLPLCVHGEVTDPEVDIFDREAAFIERVLAPLRADCPSSASSSSMSPPPRASHFVAGAAATSPRRSPSHHLILNRNHLLVGGVRPHFYCLPVVKRERHRLALLAPPPAATRASFSAPTARRTPRDAKEAACGCAGVFSAPVALACLRRSSRRKARWTGSKAFASLHGPAFYGLPRTRRG